MLTRAPAPVPNASRAPVEPIVTQAFVLVFSVHFLHCLGLNFFNLHLQGFFMGLGATESAIGTLFGVGAAMALLVRPTLGAALDSSGFRRPIFLAGVLHIILGVGHLTVSSLGVALFLLRVVHGASQAIVFTALFAYASQLVPASRRIEGLSFFGVSGVLPMGAAGYFGDKLIAHGGYTWLFIAAICCAVVGLALSAFLQELRPPSLHRGGGMTLALTNPALRSLWLLGFSLALGVATHWTFLKPFVLSHGVGSVGLFSSGYAIVAVLLRVLFGWVPERFGAKRVLVGALICMPISYVLFAFSHETWAIATAGVLLGIAHGYAFPIVAALIVARTLPENRGSAMALYTALFDVSALVAGPTMGAFIEAAGYPAMWVLLAVLVTGLAVVGLVRDARPSSDVVS